MTASYDAIVTAHYDQVAEEYGSEPSSTMADQVVRETETRIIAQFVKDARARTGNTTLTVADVGCGNGYTLGSLSKTYPENTYIGIEYNAKLRALAAEKKGPKILAGDLRDPSTIALEPGSIDALICQRVLINLLDVRDQKRALDTCIRLARPGAALLFIEVFASGLERLNQARGEFGFLPIPSAHHNLPLTDDFFQHPTLSPITSVNPQALSTHFFVSRVLHEIATKAAAQTEFVRNSHFVRFMSQALAPVGDYAPLRFMAFRKS